MINYLAQKVKGKKVAVIGLTYRPGVKELRHSRSIPLIKLLEKNGHDVFVNDPLYSSDEIKELKLQPLDDLKDMDSIIIMNKYEEYKDLLKPFSDKIIDIKK